MNTRSLKKERIAREKKEKEQQQLELERKRELEEANRIEVQKKRKGSVLIIDFASHPSPLSLSHTQFSGKEEAPADPH